MRFIRMSRQAADLGRQHIAAAEIVINKGAIVEGAFKLLTHEYMKAYKCTEKGSQNCVGSVELVLLLFGLVSTGH